MTAWGLGSGVAVAGGGVAVGGSAGVAVAGTVVGVGGRGVSVHRTDCASAVSLMSEQASRLIDVEWDKGGDPAPYTVRLTMQVEDRKGMLAALSASIADINTKLLTLEATTREENNARIDVTIEIKDMKHLEKVIKSLRSVDGVLDIERATRR